MSTDVERVREKVAQAEQADPATSHELLETLEQYECWGPYFRVMKRLLANPAARQPRDYLRLARVQNLYLEDVFAAAETCVALVSDLAVPYQRFSEDVLPQVVEFEDFAAEATILSAVSGKFKDKGDHVAALERLCMLYEKKTHNETQLGRTYEKLLEVDPRNVKALRYFKLLYSQSNEWEEVVGILKTLLGCVTHTQEVYRTAQELAAIYLYQLDMAEEAINVLETSCADSPLDTSTIQYDAYQRLADWQGCLRVLRQSLLTVDDDLARAVLHFKIASLHEQLGDLDAALDDFQKAVKLYPQFLDAVEGVIQVGVLKKDWRLIQQWLGVLESKVNDDKLKAQLKQAQVRLADGLSHAAKQPS